LISDLIDNVQLREKFGKHSRKIIEERFTLDKMGKEYMQIYENDVQII
jgi:glycosyltransferase involved in cell wall biosynthesis